jgi:hypothetical protein
MGAVRLDIASSGSVVVTCSLCGPSFAEAASSKGAGHAIASDHEERCHPGISDARTNALNWRKRQKASA